MIQSVQETPSQGLSVVIPADVEAVSPLMKSPVHSTNHSPYFPDAIESTSLSF